MQPNAEQLKEIVENYADYFSAFLMNYTEETKQQFALHTKTIVDAMINEEQYNYISSVFPDIIEKASKSNSELMVYNAYDYLFCKDTIKAIIGSSNYPTKHMNLAKILLCINELLADQIEIITTDEESTKKTDTRIDSIKDRFKIIYDDIMKSKDHENEIVLEFIELLRVCDMDDIMEDKHCIVNIDDIKHNICDFVKINN